MACCGKTEITEEIIHEDSVTREQIIESARSLLGIRFLHQGRDPQTGLDCVGFWAEVLKRSGIQRIYDLDAYKRVPSHSVLRSYIEKNFEPIELEEARRADCLLMRLGGAKPRHVALISDDTIDYKQGREPQIIHALSQGNINRVIEQPLSRYVSGVVAAFRVPNITD